MGSLHVVCLHMVENCSSAMVTRPCLDLKLPFSALGEMDIISVFETEGGSSILSGPAKIINLLLDTQWIKCYNKA